MTRSMKVFLVLLLVGLVGFSATLASARMNERTIPVTGSSLTLKVWDEAGSTYYEILKNGQSLRIAQASYELGLRYGHFDPLRTQPEVMASLAADQNVNLFIVQFHTQPMDEFQQQITQMGGTVRHYIAQYAYLVEMSNAVAAQVEQLPYVRWVGRYQPAYRLEEGILDNLTSFGIGFETKRYNIQVLSPEQKAIVGNRLTAIGAGEVWADAGKYLLEANLTPQQILQVARWNEVNFIDTWGPYEQDMDIVREIVGANYLEGVTGFSGEDVRGEIFDGGCQFGHQEFQVHPLIEHGAHSIDSHGTACMGVNFATGVNAQARGLLPDGQGVFADYDAWGLSGPNRHTEVMELLNAPYQVVFQTSSVGPPQTTQYTTISAEADVNAYDCGLILCQSQSNMGNQNSRPQAWAKNYVSGGALYHYNTLSRTDDMWGGGASIGPASDGRIKPSYTQFYDQVFTTYSTSTTGYGQFSGTSNATPCIAGCFGLFFQMWDAGIFGNTVNPNWSVFQNRPHSTTAKCFMSATTYQYAFTGTTSDKTRTHQGWGMPDLQNMYNKRLQMFFVDATIPLQNLQTHQHTINVLAGQPDLRMAMAYIDPPGNPSVQTQHRINDLSLKATSPTGVIWWGNRGLYDGPWSIPGGVGDTKNTEECIFIQNPEAGQWTLEIQANEVIQDAYPETPGVNDVAYSLVVAGVAPTAVISLDINLDPISPPIQVPANGGSFDFNASTTNLGPTQTPYTVWARMKYPDGTYTAPTLGPIPINPTIGTTITRLRTQSIPGTYPAGQYSYIAYANLNYAYPAIDSSAFTFTKLTTADGGPFVTELTCSGELFPNELAAMEPAPVSFELNGAYPNPFNPTTTISYTLPKAAIAKVTVYDLNGRLVKTLFNDWQESGTHQVTFDGSNLSSGMYVYQIQADGRSHVGKMVLMK